MNSTFRDHFSTYINDFVELLINNSEVNSFLLMFAIFLVLILAFFEISKFMLIGFDIESVTQSILMVFVTLTLMKGFPHAFDVVHETLDKFGLLILRLGTGNEDVFFLSKWINKYLYYIYGGDDASIWTMAVGDVLFALIWHIVSFILQAAMWAVGAWATWTLALAKIIGLFFVPCLILPATRSLFDGWLQFTIGSLLLLVILRAIGVLVALGIKAQFVSIGLLTCNNGQDFNGCSVAARAGFGVSAGDMMEMLCGMIISVLLIVGAIGLTAMIAGKVASPSKAVGQGMGKMAGKIASFIK